jgi:hypothetical protein
MFSKASQEGRPYRRELDFDSVDDQESRFVSSSPWLALSSTSGFPGFAADGALPSALLDPPCPAATAEGPGGRGNNKYDTVGFAHGAFHHGVTSIDFQRAKATMRWSPGKSQLAQPVAVSSLAGSAD